MCSRRRAGSSSTAAASWRRRSLRRSSAAGSPASVQENSWSQAWGESRGQGGAGQGREGLVLVDLGQRGPGARTGRAGREGVVLVDVGAAWARRQGADCPRDCCGGGGADLGCVAAAVWGRQPAVMAEGALIWAALRRRCGAGNPLSSLRVGHALQAHSHTQASPGAPQAHARRSSLQQPILQ
jgi:hypothetical protein